MPLELEGPGSRVVGVMPLWQSTENNKYQLHGAPGAIYAREAQGLCDLYQLAFRTVS